MWYWIQKKSFISNGEKNLNPKYQNLTRKEWLSATVCDTYKIEDCEKFRAKIKYFKKDLMIDLSSFVSQIILFGPFYTSFIWSILYGPSDMNHIIWSIWYGPYDMNHMILVPKFRLLLFVEFINWLYFKNTLSKFIESNIDILQNKFNLNQSSYMSLMKYYISTISKYETESSSSGKNASAAATKAFSLKLLPMYCFILLFFI